MSARSLNKVQLIGNLTRDPELRYTPTGAAVCTIGLATNRTWTTESGEKKEETEFHRVVAWNKLAELCSQLLAKGRKIYVEGRLRTNSWTGQDGTQRFTTEVVIEDMIILDSRRPVSSEAGAGPSEASSAGPTAPEAKEQQKGESSPTIVAQPRVAKTGSKKSEKKEETPNEDVNPDDIPF
jgi:single-strand DNA-binding protein